MTVDDLETPAVIVELDIMNANVKKMQDFLSAHGIACRPHVKTHKIPAIAHLQLRAGAIGVTCQKLSEAEVMVNAGMMDILIPYNIVGPAKVDRLARLVRQATVRVTVDSVTTLEALSATMHREDLTLPVMIECDLGAGRCGVQSLEELTDLARRIERL
ncbi:MAG: alanine racemase, partial [Armatimonadetes bacterium]|nr:alanine racemase [Armatimonadota bacterium]